MGDSGLVIIATKKSLNKVGLAEGKPGCVRSCVWVGPSAKDSAIRDAMKFALRGGYSVVAVIDPYKTTSGSLFQADLEFYNLPIGER